MIWNIPCKARENSKGLEESNMPVIMTTKELAKYLKLHEITICKYAAEGKIPAIRIGRVWRFDKEAIDKWISGGQRKQGT
jgi:excisionase family DNA binding protein